MDNPTDMITSDLVDMARSTLPVYVVAESPDGRLMSFSNEFPADDTEVWLETGSPSDAKPLGDMYAQYGPDLVAYAEPEPAGVTASLPDPDPAVDASDEAAVDDAATDADKAAVTAAVIHHAGNAALDEIEAFLTEAEEIVARTAAMSAPDEPAGPLHADVLRKAVGGNPEAQAAVTAMFEQRYDPDVNRFIWSALGERPADNEQHDGQAWDAIEKEARLWHAKRLAAAASTRQQ